MNQKTVPFMSNKMRFNYEQKLDGYILMQRRREQQ